VCEIETFERKNLSRVNNDEPRFRPPRARPRTRIASTFPGFERRSTRFIARVATPRPV
jgi:hypothetical protein